MPSLNDLNCLSFFYENMESNGLYSQTKKTVLYKKTNAFKVTIRNIC